jgi:hypothetical protein
VVLNDFSNSHLLVALMIVERAWAYAMQLKDDIQEGKINEIYFILCETKLFKNQATKL